MTTSVNRGVATTLTVEWREYAGGPMAEVTGVDITITSLSTGAVVLASTSTGVTYPATGVNAYVWTPAADLSIGQYLVSWLSTDADTEAVTATEVVQVVAGGALAGPYSTRGKLKKRMGIPDSSTVQDDEVDMALLSASAAINRWCGRQFGQDASPSPRTFTRGRTGVDIDDAYDLTDALVDGTALDTTRWVAEPINGIRDGVPGWPATRLSTPWAQHPIYASSPWGGTVVVTARWGWAQVPAEIESACLMLAADQLKSKDAPFGVAGFGDYAVRVRANPKVQELLAPYVREPIKVGS